MRWDDGDNSLPDDEVTQRSRAAHEWARSRVGEDVEWALVGAALRLRIPTPQGVYVAEVRGQSSVTGHGRQGALPGRIAALREVEEPVLVVYAEGGRGSVWWGWLHVLPPAINIDLDPVHRRMGWWCADLNRDTAETFRFPTEIPAAADDRLFA